MFFRKSLSAILVSFQKTLRDLTKFDEQCTTEIATKVERIRTLDVERATVEKDQTRARKIRDNLSTLIDEGPKSSTYSG